MPKKDDLPFRRGSSASARIDIDALAAEGLAFLSDDPGRLQRFFSLTGLGAGSLRQAAREPTFPLAVVSFICDDEPLLIAFAQATGLSPAAIGAAVRARSEREGWSGP